MNILFESQHPTLLVFFALAFAGVISFALYQKKKHDDFSFKTKLILIASRFIATFLTAILLLAPLIEMLQNTTEKPVLVIATDNSKSVNNVLNEQHNLIINEIKKQLTNKFNIHQYSFGETVKRTDTFNFNENLSNYSAPLEMVNASYINNNLAAVLLIGDGIYNSGIDPKLQAQQAKVPIYTIGVGNPKPEKDLLIVRTEHNDLVFAGNEFQLRVYVTANLFKNETAKISIIHKGKTIQTQEFTIENKQYNKIFDFNIKADEAGLQRYTVVVSSAFQEKNDINNTTTAIIDVIKNKQKILLLYSSPHPDVAAFSRALKKFPNFILETAQIQDFNKEYTPYNLIILHQLPAIKGGDFLKVQKIIESDIPHLLIIGQNTNLSNFNRLNTSMKIFQQRKINEMAQAIINTSFSFFDIHTSLQQFIDKAPPLTTPFGNYELKKTASALAYQKIQNIETNIPLIILENTDQNAQKKSAIIAGEGIWQWPIEEFRNQKNTTNFELLVGKLIQFLANKIQKNNFRVKTKSLFSETEDIIFNAEYYNQNFESDNKYPVNLTLTDSVGNQSKYSFTTNASAYELNIGKLAKGEYKYMASIIVENDVQERSGTILVTTTEFEKANTQANFQLLSDISKLTDGRFFEISQSDEIKNALATIDTKPILKSNTNMQSILNYRIIIFLILLFIFAEWFIRKREGSI